jgi:hypothetical protein
VRIRNATKIATIMRMAGVKPVNSLLSSAK